LIKIGGEVAKLNNYLFLFCKITVWYKKNNNFASRKENMRGRKKGKAPPPVPTPKDII